MCVPARRWRRGSKRFRHILGFPHILPLQRANLYDEHATADMERSAGFPSDEPTWIVRNPPARFTDETVLLPAILVGPYRASNAGRSLLPFACIAGVALLGCWRGLALISGFTSGQPPSGLRGTPSPPPIWIREPNQKRIKNARRPTSLLRPPPIALMVTFESVYTKHRS